MASPRPIPRRRSARRAAAALVVVGLLISATALARSVWVKTRYASIRKGKSAQSGSLERVGRGTRLRLIKVEPGFVRVRPLRGKEGYVPRRWVALKPPPRGGILGASAAPALPTGSTDGGARRDAARATQRGLRRLRRLQASGPRHDRVERFLEAAGLGPRRPNGAKQKWAAERRTLPPNSEAAERALGAEVSAAIIERHGGLVLDGPAAEYVQLVGQGMALHSSRPGLRWHFGLLRTGAVLSVSAPGGYVFISSGLLDAVADEAELAGVLGHEIAHVGRGDARTRVGATEAPAGDDEAALNADLGADEDATALLRAVGYDPSGLHRLLTRLAQAPPDKPATKGLAVRSGRLAALDAQVHRLPAGGVRGAARLAKVRRGEPAIAPDREQKIHTPGGGIGRTIE